MYWPLMQGPGHGLSGGSEASLLPWFAGESELGLLGMLAQSYLVLPAPWNPFLSSRVTRSRGGEGAERVMLGCLQDPFGWREACHHCPGEFRLKRIHRCGLFVRKHPPPQSYPGYKSGFLPLLSLSSGRQTTPARLISPVPVFVWPTS